MTPVNQNSITENNQKEDPRFSTFMNEINVRNLVRNSVGENAQRFTASICSVVATNPALQNCYAPTILSAALLGESLKLPPSPQLGYFYMVPFEDKKRKLTTAQFILGYKGYIQLAMRSGQYTDIDVIEIKEGEYMGRSARTGKHVFAFITDEDVRETLPTIGYLAYFEMLNGFRKEIYWTKQKMLAHADKYSPAFSKDGYSYTTPHGETKTKVSYEDYVAGKYDNRDEWMYSSFWYKDFDSMAFKTLIRQLISKWGIMSVDMRDGYLGDNSVSVMDKSGNRQFMEQDPDALQNPQTPAIPTPAAVEEARTPPPAPAVTAEESSQFDFFAGTDDQ